MIIRNVNGANVASAVRVTSGARMPVPARIVHVAARCISGGIPNAKESQLARACPRKSCIASHATCILNASS